MRFEIACSQWEMNTIVCVLMSFLALIVIRPERLGPMQTDCMHHSVCVCSLFHHNLCMAHVRDL